MIAYIIVIVVVAVLLLGVGGTMLLRPRGMHGVRRGRARESDLTGPRPQGSDRHPPPPGPRPPACPRGPRRPRLSPRWRSRRPRPGAWSGSGPGWPARRAA